MITYVTLCMYSRRALRHAAAPYTPTYLESSTSPLLTRHHRLSSCSRLAVGRGAERWALGATAAIRHASASSRAAGASRLPRRGPAPRIACGLATIDHLHTSTQRQHAIVDRAAAELASWGWTLPLPSSCEADGGGVMRWMAVDDEPLISRCRSGVIGCGGPPLLRARPRHACSSGLQLLMPLDRGRWPAWSLPLARGGTGATVSILLWLLSFVRFCQTVQEYGPADGGAASCPACGGSRARRRAAAGRFTPGRMHPASANIINRSVAHTRTLHAGRRRSSPGLQIGPHASQEFVHLTRSSTCRHPGWNTKSPAFERPQQRC